MIDQCHTLCCYHLVTSEDCQHLHHGDRTDSYEDDVHEDPYYDMTDTWYNPFKQLLLVTTGIACYYL